MAFVQTSGVDFILDGVKWVPMGGSTYDISTPQTSDEIDGFINRALFCNLNIIRIVNYFGGDGMNAAQWAHVDNIMVRARAAGLKVLFDLSDYTAVLANDGHDFEDQPVSEYIDLWNTFLTWVFNRENTLNGLIYKNDDTIAIVSISGEVGYVEGRTDGQFLHDWFAGTSAHIKTIDTNHIIHAGGQIPEIILSTDYTTAFGAQQDMLSIPTIDCVSTHPYYTFQNMEDLFPLLQAYSIEKQKPWFSEEFGYNQSTSAYRHDGVRAAAMRRAYNLAFKYGSAGALFWNLDTGYFNPYTGTGGGFGINSNTPRVVDVVKKFVAFPQYQPRIPVT